MNRFGPVGLLFAGLLCLHSALGAEQRKPRVLTSFLPIYCFTVNIAGEYADVQNLLPSNASVHDFQLSTADAQKLEQADLIILNGQGVETWRGKVLENNHKRVVEFSAGLKGAFITDASGKVNPHIWLDPMLVIKGLTNIVTALQMADPAHASAYAANAEHFAERLWRLDTELSEGLRAARNLPVVTYHDAFAYFARHYGLRVVGVIEEIPEIPPGPKHLTDLRRRMEKENARVIFAESAHSLKFARQLGRDMNVPVAVLDTLEGGTLSRTAYEEGMRANMKTIQQELAHYASSRAR